MRAVNLLPPELRARTAGEGDPRVAYGVIGGLAVLLLMVIVAISFSNKATTLNDQAAALEAEANRESSRTVKPVEAFNDFAGVAQSRTLLVGGLAASRFPWGNALYNLSRSLPEDVTLDDINAVTADASVVAANQETGAAAVASTALPSLSLTGCTSGWIGYSRLMVWLKEMPGVNDVKSTQSTSNGVSGAPTGDDEASKRTQNCGPAPLQFALVVVYDARKVDLVGLPKIDAPQAAGATGATGTAPSPAAQTTPPAGG